MIKVTPLMTMLNTDPSTNSLGRLPAIGNAGCMFTCHLIYSFLILSILVYPASILRHSDISCRTEYLPPSSCHDKVKLGGEEMKNVTTFKYLGSMQKVEPPQIAKTEFD